MSHTTDDSPEVEELIREIRLVARHAPNTVAALRTSLTTVRASIPTARVSESYGSICRQLGIDPAEAALAEGVALSNQRMLDRLPPERLVMLRSIAEDSSVAALAATARTLGWDRDAATYPRP